MCKHGLKYVLSLAFGVLWQSVGYSPFCLGFGRFRFRVALLLGSAGSMAGIVVGVGDPSGTESSPRRCNSACIYQVWK